MNILPEKETIKSYKVIREALEMLWSLEAKNNKGVNIYELIDRSHVPEFNRILALKLEEIKNGELKADIEAYKNKVNRYKKALIGGEWGGPKRGDENEYPRLYWFELSKFAMGDWGITKLDPWPPPIEPYYELLPPNIISYITQITADPDRLVVLEDLPYDTMNKKVDLRYIWCSPNHIVGTVRESIREWEPGLNTGVIPEGANLEFLFIALLRTIYRCPGIAKEFIRDYEVEMLPKFKKLAGDNE